MSTLEQNVADWRAYVSRRRAIDAADVDELEGHLRDQVADLTSAGLDDDEAFLIAVKRLGGLDELSQEFAREHSDRLWKQLVLVPDDADTEPRGRLAIALACGVGAGLAVRAGVAWVDPELLPRLLGLFVAPFLGLYFVLTRTVPVRTVAALGAAVVALAVPLVFYPLRQPFSGLDVGSTHILSTLHAPVVLWFLAGIAYLGGQWQSHQRRMDFIRFTGEWAVYYFLLAVGGGALTGLTAASFDLIGHDLETFITEWLVPCCAAGAVLVAAWLVEAKQNVIENILPVLARVFTPLTCLMLTAVLAAFLTNPDVIDGNRDLLVLMAAILVLVLGLYLYALSAREPLAPVGIFDRLQLLLLLLALAVDIVVLVAMIVRIAEFGSSPNKVAALGLNIVVLVNLVWSAWLSIDFLRRRRPFADVERWQTSYLPVYGAWALFVVVALPPLFDFV